MHIGKADGYAECVRRFLAGGVAGALGLAVVAAGAGRLPVRTLDRARVGSREAAPSTADVESPRPPVPSARPERTPSRPYEAVSAESGIWIGIGDAFDLAS